MKESMKDLIRQHRESLEEFYQKGKDHGFECGFLQMKVHLANYILADGKYKSTDSILKYILSLNSHDIKYIEQTKDNLPSGYNSELVQFEAEMPQTNERDIPL